MLDPQTDALLFIYYLTKWIELVIYSLLFTFFRHVLVITSF
jgi:hypothetical protein